MHFWTPGASRRLAGGRASAAGENHRNHARKPIRPGGGGGNQAEAIATTARNPNAVGPFDGGFSDPPARAELEAFAAHVETLRTALMR